MQKLQQARTLAHRRSRVGGTVEVLVEDAGFGRSRENWTVHFEGDACAGDLIEVRVTGASLAALRGTQARTLDKAAPQARRRLTVVNA